MRVAHLAFRYGRNDAGGACIAATRLHRAMLSRGVDSHYLCWEETESGENVHVLPHKGVRRFVYYLLTRCTHYILSRAFYKVPAPLNLFPVAGLERTLKAINPDVVHVHWINEDFPALSQLEHISYPMVVHLHDFFPVNAIDPYPYKDDRFKKGFEKDNSSSFERFIWNRKSRAFGNPQVLFVGPSNWICHEGASSIIGRSHRFLMIPNIVDSAFMEGTTAAKRHNRFVIIYGAHGGRVNPLKGFAELEAALRILPASIRNLLELRIFGEYSADYVVEGVLVRFLGTISSPDNLAAEYRAADLCALPSLMDNAPQTKFESLACGTPVVAFDCAGCPEGIEHGINGWVARSGDISDYAKGVEFFFGKWAAGSDLNRAEIAKCAQRDFDESRIVDEFIAAYNLVVRGGGCEKAH